ncbi:MurR/RpiR family transcriptional regulator [Leucobacter aridicollis]|uniref:MurR/RpiR family transcriptional regulator n=1 Tax=Leucobacter aridicollis TaxID=283878 RepID=UPI000E65064C|nr:MurR/RpiR family transcriptional regulator [Leucobacter aridicollis]UTX53027.1 MurR/RpiR family transcriptional regulator [Leucobacter aridicollis]
MSIQSTIEAVAQTLPPSTRRIAEVVRERPAIVLESTISDLAMRCETSEASVVRFCRALGLSGYSQLKIELATELGREFAQFGPSLNYGSDIAATDSLREMAAKISSLEILAIQETVARLDYDALERVVSAVDASDRVLLFGVGASHFIAEDLQHKLFRIGRNAFVLGDPHEALAAAALPGARTVAIGFSHRGETQETVAFLREAARSGASTVGVTSARGSALNEVANETLFTEVRETAFRAGAMVSRIAQLAVVDCVFAGVAQRRFDETVDALKVTREAATRMHGSEKNSEI